ncbi:Transcription factor Dp-1 [Orchesella cincta]|uniref:Transcription factor Dp-1 n=1 Tax=Orchesella cincta TaxID=48709 RepID=A0A1D2N7T4_ORCCI|nr:Transcription factor Dp-1 [Orchesella cincta]
MATTQGIVKNLLIKDSSGNTQMIEVVQTAPGKFVTASGHSIKTATTPGASGVKTIIRAAPSHTIQGHQPQQILVATPGTGNVTQATQIIRTSHVATTPTTIIKGGQGKSFAYELISNRSFAASTDVFGRQVLAIPVQTQGGLTSATVLKAANIKTENGAPTTFIQQRTGTPMVVGNSPVVQVIQAGNQRLLLTQTPNGPQFVTATSLGHQPQTMGQQLATIVTTGDPNQPGGSQQTITANLGPTLNLSKQNFISPILDHTGARKRVDFPSDVSYESKRRKAEKGGKGLRHFSMKVCEKVRTKGITTYNEVADELVQEFASPSVGMSSIEQQFDQKNIRRRVYDALNVLMAMNIISKEKKEIKWLGLPTNSMQECTTLEKDRQKRIERLKAKTQQLHDLIIQQVAFKCLVEKNKEREKECGAPPPHGSIHLPFLIVNTAKNTVIDCSISNDKMEYLFNFDGTFEIHDDIEVLKRMGLALGLDRNECTDEDIAKAKRVLPKALEMYIDQIGRRDVDWRAEFGDLDMEEAYYHEGETGEENVENVCYEVSGASALSLSGLSTNGDLTGMSMSVDDLEMQAAIDNLHNQSGQLMGANDTQEDHDGDEDGYDDDDDGLGE